MYHLKWVLAILVCVVLSGHLIGDAQEAKDATVSSGWRDVFFTSPEMDLVYVNFILVGSPPCVLYLRPGDIITGYNIPNKWHWDFIYTGESCFYYDKCHINGTLANTINWWSFTRAKLRPSSYPSEAAKMEVLQWMQTANLLQFDYLLPDQVPLLKELASYPNLIAYDLRGSGGVPFNMLPSHIQMLSLNGEYIDETAVENLNKLQRLRLLNLQGAHFKDEDIERLHLPHLRVLNLSNPLHVTNPEITDRSIEYICQNFPNLEVLDISDANLTEKSVVYLEKLQNLQVLNPCYVRPGLVNLANLKILYGVHKSYFTKLKELKNLCVVDAEFETDEDMVLLKDFPRLRTFGESKPHYDRHRAALKITDEGLKSLQALPLLNNLNLLGNKNITPAGFQYLKSFKNLMLLDLGSTNITDADLENIKDLANLHYLDLSHANITDAGVAHLEKLTNLVQLDLSHTKITVDALMYLVHLPNLRWLSLYGVPWSRKLARRIPNLEIVSWDGDKKERIKK